MRCDLTEDLSSGDEARPTPTLPIATKRRRSGSGTAAHDSGARTAAHDSGERTAAHDSGARTAAHDSGARQRRTEADAEGGLRTPHQLPPLPPPDDSPPASEADAEGGPATARPPSASEADDLAYDGLSKLLHGGSCAGVETVQPWLHFPRMAIVLAQTREDPRVVWALAPPGEAHEVWWGAHAIRAALNDGVAAFKIGITYMPMHRWANERYGYSYLGFSSIVFLYVSESSDHIADLERALIDMYRYTDRSGQLVGRPGNRRCLNHAPGGEGAHHGYSPFYLYIALKASAHGQGARTRRTDTAHA